MQMRHIAIIPIAFLLALAGTAGAQDQAVETRLEVTQPDPIEDWDGSPITRTVEVRLCYEEGATNPAMQSFWVNVTANGVPEWVQVNHPDEIRFTPPIGPTEAGCTDPEFIEIELRDREMSGAAPPANDSEGQSDPAMGETRRASFTLEVVLTPEAERDPVTGEEGVGNYEKPPQEAVAFQVNTAADPERVPAVALVLFLAAIGGLLATARRRRS